MLNKKILQSYNAFKPIQVNLYEIDSSLDFVNWKATDFAAYFINEKCKRDTSNLVRSILPYNYHRLVNLK